MYLAGIHVAVINSFGCATHANIMIIISLLDKYYKLYCLDFCGNSTQQWPKRKTEPINLLSSITAVTQILGDGYTHTYLVKYTFEANLYFCLNRHSGWNFGVSNVGRSQQPFFRTFWFGSSEEACVDLDASLDKASKFADILSESYSNMIGLLIHVLCKSNGDLLVIGSM